MSRIPNSVLKMLSRVWPYRGAYYAEPLLDFEHLDIVKNNYPHPKRGGPRMTAAYDDVFALVADGVLVDISEDDAAIVIDAQEQAALEYFCAEVYQAWAHYQNRVNRWRLLRDQAISRRQWAEEKERLTSRQQGILSRSNSRRNIAIKGPLQ